MVTEYLAVVNVLISDRTIDAGYNIHEYTSRIIVPQLLFNREEVQQLAGRVCRITSTSKTQKPVIIHMCRNPGFIEDSIETHLRRSATMIENNTKTYDQVLNEQIQERLVDNPTLERHFKYVLGAAGMLPK
jgi:hypothetical protein